MIRLIYKIALFLQVILAVQSSQHFRLGRSKGGNLGAPGGARSYNLPPAQWFKQKLDHFTPTDTRTWKQVYNFPSITVFKEFSNFYIMNL